MNDLLFSLMSKVFKLLTSPTLSDMTSPMAQALPCQWNFLKSTSMSRGANFSSKRTENMRNPGSAPNKRAAVKARNRANHRAHCR